MNEHDPFEQNLSDALQDATDLGAMEDADSVGTAGSEECGDMLRMWVKFREENGKRVIDKATYQTFGCQTALAVASTAARLIRGKTSEEALQLSGEDLAAPLGALPPMKIHCAQLVETALKDALSESPTSETSAPPQPSSENQASTLIQSMTPSSGKRIVLHPKP